MLTRESILLLTDAASDRIGLVTVLEAEPHDSRVQVVNDNAEALQRVDAENFDAVFCHLQSGPAEAVNFLSEVWKRKPKSARFVVAPAIDPETQMRCAFAGHQFLELPLDEDTVAAALARAQATRVILQDERVQLMVSRIRLFPSKPTIYADVMREIHSENPSLSAVGELVAKDLGIATKLIQLVNSPFYGQAQPVDDLTQAVTVLGLNLTGSVVLSLEAFARLEKVKQRHFSPDRIWSHSLRIADIARRISQICQQNTTLCAHAYLAGLLHDIGKLALAQNFHDEYHSVILKAQQQKRPLADVENEILGVSHADAGAYLLALWGLPMPIVEAVAGHHSVPDSFSFGFTPAVALHLAEQAACSGEKIDQLVLRYPPELGLAEHLEMLSESLSGR